MAMAVLLDHLGERVASLPSCRSRVHSRKGGEEWWGPGKQRGGDRKERRGAYTGASGWSGVMRQGSQGAPCSGQGSKDPHTDRRQLPKATNPLW